MIKQITIQTKNQGLIEITNRIDDIVRGAGYDEGLCTIFIQHTGASLLIQENSDPIIKTDLQKWLDQLINSLSVTFEHVYEGPDDMPSHIKSAITNSNLAIPILHGELALGTWQGIYLWEHRRSAHGRSLLVHITQ